MAGRAGGGGGSELDMVYYKAIGTEAILGS